MSAEPLCGTAPSQHKLPDGWREVPLASIAEVRFSGVNKLSLPSEEPVRLCNYTDVYNNDYITGDLEFMRATATQPEINRFGLQLGDVIITKDSETPDDIGIAAVVDYTAPDLLCGYHLALIHPRTEEVDPTFLAKQLRHDRLARYFGQQANGLTRYGLPTAVVANAPLWLPEPVKQRAIGALLRLVDEAIARTEAVIAKLKQVRAGLLHDLLTRGLDEHGQLRDPIAHPEQFQDSPLGHTPRNWEVKPCQGLCREIVVGIVVKPAQYYVEEGIPVLRSANVRENGISLTDLVFVSPESNALLSKSVLRTGDVVTVRTGYPGTSCVVPPHLDGANCVDLIISRPSGEIVPEFLALWINSPFGRDQVLRVHGGLAQQHFNVGELKALLVAKPERDEQREMVRRVGVIDSQARIETDLCAKLQLLKSGLMADLLTGRVRVPEDFAVRRHDAALPESGDTSPYSKGVAT
jgi:type I restriction enzyme S subunit